MEEAVSIGSEIAEALEEAHEQGIVHRDLKPSNIMLTPKGHVQVLDFGLAKRVADDEQEITTALTREGATLGTLSYMSPEQLEGKKLDTRSDIFSFGIVLYEMLTGVHPFRKSQSINTMAAILHEESRPLSDYIDHVSELLCQTVSKMLAKEPEERYQTVQEVATNLNHPSPPSKTRVRPALFRRLIGDTRAFTVSERGRRQWVRPWFLLVLLAGITAVLFYWLIRRPDAGVPRLLNPVQLTSALGVENHPTWAPDGDRLAYESDQNGNWDIWVTQLGQGDSVNLTAQHSGPDRYPAWSPDGRQIAFVSEREEGWGLYSMASVGGTPRRLLGLDLDPVYYRGAPRWSADGREIAVALWTSGRRYVEIFSLETQEARRVPLPRPEGNPCMELSWSPDGQLFAYVEADGDAAEVAQIWVVSASGGEAVPVTDGLTNDRNPSWSKDGRGLYFVSNRIGTMDLWYQAIDTDGRAQSEAQRVTTGVGLRSAAFSPDGTRVAYSQGRKVSNLWRIPILKERPADWKDAEQLTFDNALIEFLDVSPDGTQLTVSSDRAGNQDVWVLPVEAGSMSQLTTDVTPDWGPRWSPDGKEIAFYAYRSGNRDIWAIPSGGGPARQITFHPADDVAPVWSPDGSEIAFTSRRSGNRDIWIVPAQGGQARQITDYHFDAIVWDWSEDGEWLVGGETTGAFFRIPERGGQWQRLGMGLTEPRYGGRLSSERKALYFPRSSKEGGNLWAISLEDDSEYPVSDLAGRIGALGWGLATDGRYLYFTWAQPTGDLWMMDVADAGS